MFSIVFPNTGLFISLKKSFSKELVVIRATTSRNQSERSKNFLDQSESRI